MRQSLPYSVFKRKDKPYYFVKFKCKETGNYLSPISTKKANKAEALETAKQWYLYGIPTKETKTDIEKYSLRHIIKSADITAEDAAFIIKELQKQGFVKSAVLTDSKQDIDITDFMLNFWDYDKSPYVREKLRKNHGIHRKYCAKQYGAIKNHWVPAFKGRLLSAFTRRELDDFITHFEDSNLTANGKNALIQAGTIALSWAYKKELIEKDVTQVLYGFRARRRRGIY